MVASGLPAVNAGDFEPKLMAQTFDAIVTGRSSSDTWVRILQPPVEGMLVGRYSRLDVGETCRVKLVSTDVVRGFIDFVLVA